MVEKALAVPLDTEEIITIAVAEFRKRLRGLSPLQGLKEYVGFEVSFHVDVKLFRLSASPTLEKTTLAWGRATGGDTGITAEPADAASDISQYKSDPDVNAEREKHDLPLTVETGDGQGGKIRKKVHVKKNAK